MGQPAAPPPELLVVAAFSRHPAAFAWARARLEAACGPVALASPPYPFAHTTYYQQAMGSDLSKVLWAFRDLQPPDRLADLKLASNRLEAELAAAGGYPEPRPINLDPGLLSLGKFLLATTKDQIHRIYLRDGIFAEVTLRYQDGQFRPWPWTYADYQLPEVLEFLSEARRFYKGRLTTLPHP